MPATGEVVTMVGVAAVVVVVAVIAAEEEDAHPQLCPSFLFNTWFSVEPH